MSVVFDAQTTDKLFAAPAGGTTTFDYLNSDTGALTVGANSNEAIFFIIVYAASTATPHVSSVTWDQGGTNQSASAVTGAKGQRSPTSAFGNANTVEIWQLAAPTTGNKTWRVVMSATPQDIYMAAVCYSGVNQSTPAANGTGSSGAATPSLTVTSATGDATVAGWCVDQLAITSTSGTQIFDDGGGSVTAAAGNRDVGAATVTMTILPAASQEWAGAAIDVVAAGAAAANPPYDPYRNQPNLASILAQKRKQVGWTPYRDPRFRPNRKGLLFPNKTLFILPRKIMRAA